MKTRIAVTILVLVLLLGAGYAFFAYRWHHRVVGQFFDSDGIRIHYTVEGQGEPVILIHGFAANADLNWRVPGITEALARDYRVIALDARGHGLSGKPHDSDQYGIKMVDDVVRLMDHLEIEKAHIVGYSMGGFITLKLLAMYPERVISAAPCGAGWGPPGEGSDFRERLAEALESRGDFRPLFVMLDPEGKGPGWLATRLTNWQLNSINDPKALAAVIRSMGELAVTEDELRANTVPTLSVVGTEDPLRAGVDRLTGVMSNHEVKYIEGANHLTALGSELLADIKTFLDAHRETKEAPADAA